MNPLSIYKSKYLMRQGLWGTIKSLYKYVCTIYVHKIARSEIYILLRGKKKNQRPPRRGGQGPEEGGWEHNHRSWRADGEDTSLVGICSLCGWGCSLIYSHQLQCHAIYFFVIFIFKAKLRPNFVRRINRTMRFSSSKVIKRGSTF